MVSSSYFKKKVFVGQRGTDGQSYGVDDMSDIYAYFDSAQGYPTSIRSPTYFWDQACRFQRPSDNLYGYNIRTGLVDHDVDVYFPIPQADILTDYFLLRDTVQEIKNKIITPATNTLSGIEKFPDFAKSGKYQGNSFSGEGMMESMIHRHSPELKGDSTYGSYAQYTTPSTTEESTGLYVPSEYMTMPQFDPIFKARLRIPDYTLATNRLFFGLVSSDTILQSDTPFGLNDAAVLFGLRNTDSDIKMFRGVGNGVTVVSPYSTNFSPSSTVFELEFGFRKSGAELYYVINNGAELVFTSDLPQVNKWLKLHVNIQNTTTDDRHLDCFYVRIESKR